jgi:cytochrome P450
LDRTEQVHANDLARFVAGDHSVLFANGPRHQRKRTLMLPPFHGQRMMAYTETMRNLMDDVMDGWRPGDALALHPVMQDVTLQVILRCVFGLSKANRVSQLHDALQSYLDFSMNQVVFTAASATSGVTVRRVLNAVVNRPWLVSALERAGVLPSMVALARARKDVRRILMEEISRCRTQETDGRTDVLAMLVSARDENGEAMGDDELYDELVTLLIAGHETTATSLSWAMHHVLRHPHCVHAVRAEVDAVTGGAPVTAEHVGGLHMVEAVLNESMRLSPIATSVIRRLLQPLRVGPYELPTGTLVCPSVQLIHRRADLYPDPDAFCPERFLEHRPAPHEFLPFGGGVRRCVGMVFANFEMRVVLATLLRRATLRLGSQVPPRAVFRGFTLAPEDRCPVIVDRVAPRPAPASSVSFAAVSH